MSGLTLFRLFGFMFIVSVSNPLVPCSAQVNLLQNGSFERRTVSGIPDSWTRAYVSTGGSSSRSTNMVQYGDYALKLTDGDADNGEGVVSDAIPVVPGVLYTAQAFVYRTNGLAVLYLRYYNATNGVVSYVSVPGTATNVWEYISISNRAPIDATYARLICCSSSSSIGTMYFDAVSFFRSQVNMVDNPAMDLDAVGSYPVNWTNYYLTGVPEPVSVGTDASKGHIMVLTDDSASCSAASATRMPVIGNMTYTASAEMFWVNGTSPSLYIKYRDRTNGLIGTGACVYAPTAGVWTTNTVTLKAPENAVEAQLLAFTGFSATGTAYFVNFTFAQTNFVNKFVAPSALGDATGRSATNAAKYNSTSFWSTVQSLLATQSVIVDFKSGDYAINNNNNDKLNLTNIGTTNNALVLAGRRPFGSVFTRTSSADASANRTMVELSNAKNIVLRHLHWEESAPAGKTNGYGLVINTDTNFPNAETKNIALEGCSFVGMTQSYYGAMGFHDPGTHRGTVWNCEFVNVGFGGHSHMIYNSGGSYDLETLDSYFEDSRGGSYVRHAYKCHDALVSGNRFIDTGNMAYHRPFLEVTTFNDTTNDNQIWGYNFTYTDNAFEYPSMSDPEHVAIRFLHYGFDPVVDGVTWHYLLNTTDKNTLLNGTTSQKTTLVNAHYGLNFGSEVTISGNTRIGYHAYNIRLTSESYWDDVPDYGGNGDYNISALDGN